MSTTSKWIKKVVPKERCNEEKEQLKAEGFEINPDCPEDDDNPRMCVIKYRATFDF
jgi:hypothetical protein